MALDPTAIVEVSTFTAAIYPPLVGTTVLAADVKALAQATANRTAYLNSFAKIAGIVLLEFHSDALGTTYSTWGAGTTAYVNPAGSDPLQVDMTGCLVGDVLKIDVTVLAFYNTTGGGGTSDTCLFQLVATDDFGGAAVADTLNAHGALPASSEAVIASVMIPAVHTVANAGTTRIKVQTRSVGFAGNPVVALGYSINVLQLRA